MVQKCFMPEIVFYYELPEMKRPYHQQIINLLNYLYQKKEKEEEDDFEYWYNRSHRGEIAYYSIKKEIELQLKDHQSKTKHIPLKLYDRANGEWIETILEVKCIDKETWDIAELINEEDACRFGEAKFTFILNPKKEEMIMPYCNPPMEISDERTIYRNNITSSCDTYATKLGVPAEGLYLVYITDLDELGLIKEKYWEF